ncbi:MAG: NADH-quinone oxidoreductase subunit H, partial [Acidimicrobiia bacterium]
MTLLAELLDSFWFVLALKLVIVATVIPVIGMAIGYAELKISAHMQSRIGPYFAGGRFGWAQLIADGVKFMQKEDIIPEQADAPVFRLSPVLVFIGTVALFVVIPIGPGERIVRDLDIGIFYALAISSVSTIGILTAGWSSANKYSLMG